MKEVCVTMKKKIMSEFFYVVLLIAWLTPVKTYLLNTEKIIGMICYLLSIVLICIVKNKYLASCIVVLISVGMSIYDYQYIFSAVAPILLICAYQIVNSESKTRMKQSNGLSNVFTTATMIITAVQLIYSVAIYDKSADQFFKSIVLLYRTAIPIVLLFVIFYWFAGRNKDKKRNKEKISELKMILLLSVINMLTFMVYYFASQGISQRSLNVDFLGWYAFLLILSKKDLFANQFFETLEKHIKILVGKT